MATSVYATPDFWVGAFERALKTAAQVIVGAVGTAALFEWDVKAVAGLAGAAVITSVLTSIVDAKGTATNLVPAYAPNKQLAEHVD